ncbi:MAG: hypothetical protein N3B18_02055 [Desulfobacterota bacterium]|nr:hypothetical protein [Thermodesulfobacteriota bacterium]
MRLKIPKAVFAAIDYHLDWLYASLKIAASNDTATVFPNRKGMIKAHQEDVDFLIAYEANDVYHLILIEAKGVTGLTNKQMTSKANRLRDIFGDDGTK